MPSTRLAVPTLAVLVALAVSSPAARAGVYLTWPDPAQMTIAPHVLYATPYSTSAYLTDVTTPSFVSLAAGFSVEGLSYTIHPLDWDTGSPAIIVQWEADRDAILIDSAPNGPGDHTLKVFGEIDGETHVTMTGGTESLRIDTGDITWDSPALTGAQQATPVNWSQVSDVYEISTYSQNRYQVSAPDTRREIVTVVWTPASRNDTLTVSSSYGASQPEVSAVPEPGTLALALTGLGALGLAGYLQSRRAGSWSCSFASPPSGL